MKTSSLIFLAATALSLPLFGDTTGTAFTNFIRQVQLPSPPVVEYDKSVSASSTTTGAIQSPLGIDPGGARFELWTVKNTNPPTSYLLDSKYVGTFVPMSTLKITTEDSAYLAIPRTRADRPYSVTVTVEGLITGNPAAPVASQSVNLLRHVQSYGTTGTGVNIDRTQATLKTTTSLNQNRLAANPYVFNFTVNEIPGSDRAKIRGEERFSIYSLDDYQSPAAQLAAQFVQIWPVADGAIAGITNNQLIRFALPNVTLTLNDLYPDSNTYAQVYKGAPALGKTGWIVPGSSLIYKDSVPTSRVLSLTGYDSVFDEGGDGQWTMELITVTPFGADRLAYVTFSLDRTIEMNGSVKTQE